MVFTDKSDHKYQGLNKNKILLFTTLHLALLYFILYIFK